MDYFVENSSEITRGFMIVVGIVVPIGIAYWTWVYGKKHYDMRMFLSMSFFAILSSAACTVAGYYMFTQRDDPIGVGIGLAGACLLIFGIIRNMVQSNPLFGLWYSIVQFTISMIGVLAVVYLFFRRRVRWLP
ncbi:MAG: hypothetical protein AAF826_11820 [Pseudomonadota bacterium]